MRFMISQPMGNLSEKEILSVRNAAVQKLESMGHTVLDTYFIEPAPSGVRNDGLYYLGISLSDMAKCDAVYFCKGWKNTRGCKIEHDAAIAYNLKVVYD